MFLPPLHGTLGFITIYQSVNVKFFELPHAVLLLFGLFFDFTLFFVFLSCIPIMLKVFQVESLMDIRIYEPLRSTRFSFETTHFITNNY